MIRDKLVFGIRDDGTKQKLLSKDELQLKQSIGIARAAEASKSQAKMMTISMEVSMIKS